MNTKQFKAEHLNLDDEETVSQFISSHKSTRGRTLANRLGFRGRGATKAANALSNYAWNKLTAISLRQKGNIAEAQRYEAICDRIYSQDIQQQIECW